MSFIQGEDWTKEASKRGILSLQKKRVEIYLKNKKELLERAQRKDFWNLVARLCGFISGEGSIYSKKDKKGWARHEIRFYPDNVEVAKIFLSTFEEVYNQKPSIRKETNYYRILVISKLACEHLMKISTYGTHTWKVPEFVWHSESAKIEFLRAIFDCEASVNKKNIQLQSVNAEGINEIKKLLNGLKIDSKIYIYKRKNPKWSTNYLLIISKKENIKRYNEQIGFNHPLKMKKAIEIAGVPEW